MKRNLAFTLVVMFAIVVMTSCSMQSMIYKNLEKKGYVMSEVTPSEQLTIAPLLSAFPTFNYNAIGYLASTYSVSYIYSATTADWNAYGAQLTSAGFSKLSTGYVKADKNAGITYNVSAKSETISDNTYLIVTFISKAF